MLMVDTNNINQRYPSDDTTFQPSNANFQFIIIESRISNLPSIKYRSQDLQAQQNTSDKCHHSLNESITFQNSLAHPLLHIYITSQKFPHPLIPPYFQTNHSLLHIYITSPKIPHPFFIPSRPDSRFVAHLPATNILFQPSQFASKFKNSRNHARIKQIFFS